MQPLRASMMRTRPPFCCALQTRSATYFRLAAFGDLKGDVLWVSSERFWLARLALPYTSMSQKSDAMLFLQRIVLMCVMRDRKI
jgi:hypothetical protein